MSRAPVIDPPAPPPRDAGEAEAWDALVRAARAWARHMDQWNKFRFQTDFGTVYVTIGRDDPRPDGFDEVSA